MPLPGDTSGYKFFTATSTSDGDYGSPAVAAVTGRKLRILGLTISVLTTAGTVTVKSGGGSTLLAHTLVVGTPLVVGYTGVPICETVAGESLLPNNGTGVDSFISGTYVEVTP